MNTQHLQYLIEIERVSSISQAAMNLYISQPNLSRILREIEEDLGFSVFERSSRGVTPTAQGAVFLQHAHTILREMESIALLGPRRSQTDRLRVCLPRSGMYFRRVADFLSRELPGRPIDAVVRECHAKRTIELLTGSAAELGIIRFRTEYQPYFEKQLRACALRSIELPPCEYRVLVHRSHPLAKLGRITLAQLRGYAEISHSDNYFLPPQQEKLPVKRVYTVDRMAQLTMLETVPGSYLWSEPAEQTQLDRWELVQLECGGHQNRYTDLLIYNPVHVMSNLESALIRELCKEQPCNF